jgi:protein transport protein SEC23
MVVMSVYKWRLLSLEVPEDSPNTFKDAEMLFFPSFMFHLRRSQFVQVFGNSPTRPRLRILLNRENTRNAIL